MLQTVLEHSNRIRDLHNVLTDPTQKHIIDLLTPEECYEEYPKVHFINWTAERIEEFFNSKLLVGVRNGSGRSSLIARPSFVTLIELANENLDNMKIHL